MRRNQSQIWKELNDASNWLSNILLNGPTPLEEILFSSIRKGISRTDLNKVRRSLKIITVRVNGISYWKLPDCEVCKCASVK